LKKIKNYELKMKKLVAMSVVFSIFDNF